VKKGDLVRELFNPHRLKRIGLITKVFLTESGNEEYRVAWLNAGGRSRCVRALLELASEER
jgi:hypothetical protein